MGYQIAIVILFVIIGYQVGWVRAHSTVATECEKLGKFYVGDTVYECTAVTKVEKNDH